MEKHCVLFDVTLLLSLFMLLPFSHADECANYSPDPKQHALTLNICSQFAYSTIFVPTNYTQPILDQNIYSAVRLALFFNSKQCTTSFLNLLCRTGYRECGRINSFLPSPPCKAQCHEMMRLCADDFNFLVSEGSGAFLSQLGCDQLDNLTQGQDLWPTSVVYYPVFGRQIPVMCSNQTGPTNYTLPADSCPPLFAHNAEKYHASDDVAFCEPACPISFISAAERKTRNLIIAVTSAFSFIGVSLFVFFYLLYPLGRKYPARYKLNVMFCALGVAVALLLTAANGTQRVLCHDSTTIATQQDPLCAVQGVFLVYFGVGASVWWTLLPFHLYLSVRFYTLKRRLREYEKYFQIFGWGVPLICIVIGLARQRVGNYKGATLCLLDDTDNFAYQYALFYIPICVSLVVGFTFFGLTCAILISAEKKTKRKVSISKYRTVLGFCWIGISIYAVVVANRFYNSVLVESTTNSVTAWILCYATSFAYNLDGMQSCGEVPAARPNTSFDSFFVFTLGSCGVVATLVYASETRFVAWMARIFIRVYRFDFHLADLNDVDDSSDLSTNKTSSVNNEDNAQMGPSLDTIDRKGLNTQRSTFFNVNNP